MAGTRKWTVGVAAAAALVATVLGMPGAEAADTADTTPPTITDLGIADGALVHGTTTIHVLGSSDIKNVQLLVGENVVRTRTAAPWDLIWNTGSSADGDVAVRIVAIDAAGNRTTSDPITVRVDNTAPVVYLHMPAYRVNGVVQVMFVASPGQADDLAKVELYAGGKFVGTVTSAPWTLPWDTAADSGPVTVTSRAYDLAGNHYDNSGASAVTVDHAGPSAQILFPVTDGYVRTGDIVQVFTLDDAGVDQTELSVDGTVVGTSTGGGSVNLPWASAGSKATLGVRTTDKLGNVTTVSRSVTVDDDQPVVTVSPAAGARLRGVFTASLASARDASGAKSLSVKLDTTTYTPAASSPWLVRIDGRTVRDGQHTLTWTVTDRAGNEAVVRRTVVVDNHGPAVSFGTAPSDNVRLTRTVTIGARATDAYGVSRVQLLVNGKLVATDSTAGYAFSLNPKKYGTKFTVQYRAYDLAGNVSYGPKRTFRR